VDSLRRGFASKLSGVHQTGSSPTNPPPFVVEREALLGN
jgi:hypothetical protein